MVTLYKAYALPDFEYRPPLLLGILRTLNYKLECANHYALRSILNFGNSVTYGACLSIKNQKCTGCHIIAVFCSFVYCKLSSVNYILFIFCTFYLYP